jgi:transcriptional regulator with XRE-family HTH domain
MNDFELKRAVLDFKRNYGSSLTFIASRCGVSREHLSRWIHNESYTVSNQLKEKLCKLLQNQKIH